jgi:hypothetical protein
VKGKQMQKTLQNFNDEMNLVPQPIREDEGGTDPGPRNVLSELTCAVTVDSKEADMAINTRRGTVQKVSHPQSFFRYLGSDRLSMNRAGAMWSTIKGGLVILIVLNSAHARGL